MKKIIYTIALSILTSIAYSQNDFDAPPPPLQEQKVIEENRIIQNSGTTLSIRNNTGKVVYASYVYYDKSESSWTSKGWYSIEAYGKKVLSFGNYTGAIYIHGETIGLLSNTYWGDKWDFCTEPNKSFSILFSDKVNCSHKSKFTKYTLKAGENKWTFNP